jgi:F0F1-type ATP synthase membrane subunit b/b'
VIEARRIVPPVLATSLIELINFLLLAGLLGWLLFKPVRAALLARQAAERTRAAEIDARTAEIDRLRADWQTRTAAFEREMAEMRTARLATAERDAAAVLAQAREATERERARAARALAQIEEAQIAHLAAALASAARDAVEGLLAAIDAPDLQTSLVGTACRQLQRLDGPSLGSVVVESTTPLGDRDRQAIATAIGTRASALEWRVTPDLGPGVRIATGRGLIDASAAGLAAGVARRLHDRLAASPQETGIA